MNKIQRVSRFFRVLFQICFVGYPVLVALGWALVSVDKPYLLDDRGLTYGVVPDAYMGGVIQHALSASEKLQGFLVSMPSLSIGLLALYFLIKVFRCYERSEIFSLNIVHYLRNIGYLLLAGQFVGLVREGVLGWVLTRHNPPGHGMAVLSFSQTNLGIILVALLVILMSWIMAEGLKLKEEQQLTV